MQIYRRLLMIIPVAMLIMSLVVLFGCRSSELTRGKAQQIIDADKAFSLIDANQRANYTLSDEEIQNGIKAGYWLRQYRLYAYELVLAPKGKELFSTFALPGVFGGVSRTVITKATTKRRVVEITGITDAPGGATPGTVKEVEFTWGWDDSPFPDELKSFVKGHPTTSGGGTFRLYDDGWRFTWVR